MTNFLDTFSDIAFIATSAIVLILFIRLAIHTFSSKEKDRRPRKKWVIILFMIGKGLLFLLFIAQLLYRSLK